MQEVHCAPLCSKNQAPVPFPPVNVLGFKCPGGDLAPKCLCGCSLLCNGAEEPTGAELMAALVLLNTGEGRSLWSCHTSSLQLSTPHFSRNAIYMVNKPGKTTWFADHGTLFPCLYTNRPIVLRAICKIRCDSL